MVIDKKLVGALENKREALTDQEQLFVDKYLRHFKPELAMMEAGYSEIVRSDTGSILKLARIKRAIKERLELYSMSKEEILWRLSEMGRNAYAEYIDEYGNIDLKRMLADGKGFLIRGITPTRYGNKIEFMDGLKALELMGRYHKLFNGDTAPSEVVVRVVFEDNLLTDRSDTPEVEYIDGVIT